MEDENVNDHRPVQWRNPHDPDLYFANCAKLPEMAFALHPSDPQVVIMVKRGHGGHWRPGKGHFPDKDSALGYVREMNTRLEVTSAEANALLNGSLFGFDTPSGDPANVVNTDKCERLSDYVKPEPNEGNPMTTVLDFGVLLKKYMRHVQMCEGVAFWGSESSGELNSDVTFTPAEAAALDGLLNEIRSGA